MIVIEYQDGTIAVDKDWNNGGVRAMVQPWTFSTEIGTTFFDNYLELIDAYQDRLGYIVRRNDDEKADVLESSVGFGHNYDLYVTDKWVALIYHNRGSNKVYKSSSETEMRFSFEKLTPTAYYASYFSLYTQILPMYAVFLEDKLIMQYNDVALPFGARKAVFDGITPVGLYDVKTGSFSGLYYPANYSAAKAQFYCAGVLNMPITPVKAGYGLVLSDAVRKRAQEMVSALTHGYPVSDLGWSIVYKLPESEAFSTLTTPMFVIESNYATIPKNGEKIADVLYGIFGTPDIPGDGIAEWVSKYNLQWNVLDATKHLCKYASYLVISNSDLDEILNEYYKTQRDATEEFVKVLHGQISEVKSKIANAFLHFKGALDYDSIKHGDVFETDYASVGFAPGMIGTSAFPGVRGEALTPVEGAPGTGTKGGVFGNFTAEDAPSGFCGSPPHSGSIIPVKGKIPNDVLDPYDCPEVTLPDLIREYPSADGNKAHSIYGLKLSATENTGLYNYLLTKGKLLQFDKFQLSMDAHWQETMDEYISKIRKVINSFTLKKTAGIMSYIRGSDDRMNFVRHPKITQRFGWGKFAETRTLHEDWIPGDSHDESPGPSAASLTSWPIGLPRTRLIKGVVCYDFPAGRLPKIAGKSEEEIRELTMVPVSGAHINSIPVPAAIGSRDNLQSMIVSCFETASMKDMLRNYYTNKISIYKVGKKAMVVAVNVDFWFTPILSCFTTLGDVVNQYSGFLQALFRGSGASVVYRSIGSFNLPVKSAQYHASSKGDKFGKVHGVGLQSGDVYRWNDGCPIYESWSRRNSGSFKKAFPSLNYDIQFTVSYDEMRAAVREELGDFLSSESFTLALSNAKAELGNAAWDVANTYLVSALDKYGDFEGLRVLGNVGGKVTATEACRLCTNVSMGNFASLYRAICNLLDTDSLQRPDNLKKRRAFQTLMADFAAFLPVSERSLYPRVDTTLGTVLADPPAKPWFHRGEHLAYGGVVDVNAAPLYAEL